MIAFTLSQAATLAAFASAAQALIPELPRDESLVELSPRQAAIQFDGTPEGCFSSLPGGSHPGGSYTYQSSGWCGKRCAQMGFPVMAIQDSNCICGDTLPPSSSSASDTSCSFVCPGYGDDICGGPKAYTIWLTGVPGDVTPVGNANANNVSPSPTQTHRSNSASTPPSHSTHSSSHSHTTQSKTGETNKPHATNQSNEAKTSTITKKQTTIFKTVHGSPTESPNSSSDSSQGTSSDSSSPSGTTIGIIVGIVAGVVVFAALVALLLFYLRRRRRMKNAENGHRRADSLNAFVASGGHMPGSVADRFPGTNVNDNRLEPGIMRETRRESVGSVLADNQDYSRRILKVTNPDGT